MNRRVFATGRVLSISTAAFQQGAKLIAGAERDYEPNLVIGIERGGHPLAQAIAALLHIPATTIGARHNASDQTRIPATGLVTVDPRPLATVPPGSRALLVDDICGSGATLATVAARVTALLRPASMRTATLCRNSGATTTPQTWLWEVSDWVHFPWEPPPDVPTTPLAVPDSVRHQ